MLFSSPDGRKKIEEMYHPTSDRSEFYSMSDILKPPVLFTPSEDLDKVSALLSRISIENQAEVFFECVDWPKEAGRRRCCVAAST